MKKLIVALTLTFGVIGTANADNGSAQNGSAASKHAALASTKGLKASGQVASAAVAVPLLVVGKAGEVSVVAGTKLMETAVGEKLKVTEKTITTDPAPNKVVKKQEDEK